MNIAQIVENLKKLNESWHKGSFIYDFLLAYDTNKSVIQRFKKGQLNISKNADEIIWKKKLFYKVVTAEEIQSVLESISKDARVAKNHIRFIIVTDLNTLAAIDTKSNERIETALADLVNYVTFFLPLAGMETYTAPLENEADVKAAVQMAKLFDEIKKNNPTETAQQVHHLNIFLSRLLFCFFAEDTGIFPKYLFTGSISNQTQQDGSDLGNYIEQLFDVLNTEKRDIKTPAYLKVFPYVNGGLFKDPIPLPVFTFKSRKAIIESGGENWAAINPDIFGSMIQAVITPEKRSSLGMHYTSVPNIMKVVKPLFLDELYEEFEAAKNNPSALNKLLARIASIRIFDPACGSGNFLIIAYKELRYLEIQILLQLKGGQANTFTGFEEKQQRLFPKRQLSLADSKPKAAQMELFSRIELNHFFGIELDDFAHEVAKLSLWLAQHQMNVEFNKLIGTTNPSLPLRDAGVIVQGNATRLNWEKVCPKPKIGEVFILGNPPYLGSGLQSVQQKNDMAYVFTGIDDFKKLDFIACWFFLGKKYITNFSAKFAFVSTNSICQGEQVSILWPQFFNSGLEIFFAYQSFKWKNNAKANAAVSVVIIGISNSTTKNKFLYAFDKYSLVKNINPYLVASSNIFVIPRKTSLSKLPEMIKGSSPGDNGNLILSEEETNKLIKDYPLIKKIIKKYVGADELMKGKIRYCLWISDNNIGFANSIPEVKERFEKCRIFREKSKKEATIKIANTPYFFDERKFQELPSIIVPQTGSEKREYIPISFVNSDTIISNAARVIYTSEFYIFSIIISKMHIIWVRAVAGRLKMDMQYSNTLCYNTFPFPLITSIQKSELEKHVHDILEQRAKHTEKTLAEMYDPKNMPEGLLIAHRDLDATIEKCYRAKPFESDEERLAWLFKLYEQMIAEEKTKGTLFATEPKLKKRKRNKYA